MRWLPFAGVLTMLAFVFVRRPRLRRRGAAQHLRDAFAVALFALLLAQSLVAALAPESLPLAQADRRAPAVARHAFGTLLMLAGIVLLVTTQARPGLVTSGVYALSRNPIFLALLVIVAATCC